jgi:hypothetical protein
MPFWFHDHPNILVLKFLSSFKRIIIAITTAICLSLFLFFIALFPLIISNKNAIAQNDLYTTQIEFLKKKNKEILQQALEKNSEKDDPIEIISLLLKQNNLYNHKINFETIKQEKLATEKTITISGEGYFNEIFQFFKNLEVKKTMHLIDNIKIKKSKKNQIIIFNAKIKSYDFNE